MQIRVMGKLEESKRDWRAVQCEEDGREECFGGCCSLQCSVVSMRTLHLISRTEIDELLLSL